MSDGCTWWPDGWPWNPNLWRPCCETHDLGGSDWELFLCVGQTGGPLEWAMGLIMLIGLFLFGWTYRLWKRHQPASAGFFLGERMMQYAARRAVNEIIVHCAATPEGRDISVADIRRWHVNGNGWRDIGYHFVITLDGTIHAGRPINQTGAHVRGRNRGTIGVCYVGGVANDGRMTPKDTRTPAQKAALERLLLDLLAANPDISRISGHRDYAAKACPSFDATAEYRPLLDRRLGEARFTDHSQVEEEGTPPHQSTTTIAAGVSGTAATVSTVSYAAREAAENGRTILESFGDLWPLAIAAVVIVGAAVWVIRERRRHARENGV